MLNFLQSGFFEIALLLRLISLISETDFFYWIQQDTNYNSSAAATAAATLGSKCYTPVYSFSWENKMTKNSDT